MSGNLDESLTTTILSILYDYLQDLKADYRWLENDGWLEDHPDLGKLNKDRRRRIHETIKSLEVPTDEGDENDE